MTTIIKITGRNQTRKKVTLTYRPTVFAKKDSTAIEKAANHLLERMLEMKSKGGKLSAVFDVAGAENF